MKFSHYFVLLIAFLSIGFFIRINHINSEEVKTEILEKKAIAIIANNTIDSIKKASYTEVEIMDLIIRLTDDYDEHKNIGKKLSDEKISEFEVKKGFNLPNSYKFFLKYFGDGVKHMYNNPNNSIDQIEKIKWLREYNKSVNDKIEIGNEYKINSSSLLCITEEDSQGGIWCWLTSEKNENGEWPLVYYNINDKKINYKVFSFTEWLSILVDNKSEVTKELNRNYKKLG